MSKSPELALNPRQIEAFRAVMDAGNMTAGAAVLGITQPAVSRLIRDLEGSVGLKLFFREGNRLVPTREGMILHSEADKVFRGLDHLSTIATELRQARVGNLRIASIVSLSSTCIPAAMASFQKRRPSVITSLGSFDSHVVVDAIEQHQFDIGFAQLRDYKQDVTIRPLPVVEALCILPTGSPLADKSVIRPDDLNGSVFISTGKKGSMQAKTDAMLREHGVSNVRFIETTLAASAKALVSRGMGLSIVDPFTALTDRNSWYVVRRFEPRLTYEATIVYPKYRETSRLGAEFGKEVIEQFMALDPARVR